MSISAAVGGQVRERALLVFVVLAGLLAMHGLTTGHDALMPSSHQPPSSATSHADNRTQHLNVALAGVVITAAMDGSMGAGTNGSTATGRVLGHVAVVESAVAASAVSTTVTGSVASSVNGMPMPAMTMGAACIAILTGALALLLLALALAHSRSRSDPVPGHQSRAPRWPTDLGPPRRTSLTLVQLSLSRT